MKDKMCRLFDEGNAEGEAKIKELDEAIDKIFETAKWRAENCVACATSNESGCDGEKDKTKALMKNVSVILESVGYALKSKTFDYVGADGMRRALEELMSKDGGNPMEGFVDTLKQALGEAFSKGESKEEKEPDTPKRFN